MRNLIKFISLYNYSITFYLLVFFSSYFLVNDNFVLKTKYLNSSNYIIGTVFSFQTSITDYFRLEEKNKLLETENKLLKEKIINTSENLYNDSLNSYSFSLIEAEVINNSLRKTKNYITINRGSKDGIKEGMGVISSLGIVGKIKYVSDNFSTIISLLNTSFFVSSLIEESRTLSSVNWDGSDPTRLKLLYVPKHLDIVEGAKIISSSFDAIYPKGLLIGKITSINSDVNSNFYDIEISSSQNFYNLSKVYVINNSMYEEKKNLEKANLLYKTIDESNLFKGIANSEDRSIMNVTFSINEKRLDDKFNQMCIDGGINGIKGHRSVGGFRASMYNAMSIKSVKALIEIMKELERKA